MKKNCQMIKLASKIEYSSSDFLRLESLGSGSFATVIKVQHKTTQQIFALKAIKKDIILQNRKVESVKRELEIMYALTHENVIKLFGHYEDEDNINLVLEYIQGGNLYEQLQKNDRLSEQDAVIYMRQIVKAIQYLHNQPMPVLHRDIKPENILLDEKKTVKLGDFGSANSVSQDKKRYTFEGTKIYMAPEIIENQGYDQTVDIWSLGVLVYELLSGETPFLPSQKRDTLSERDQNILLEENIKNVKIVFHQDFPALARDLIRKMLRHDPSQRSTLKEILEHPWMKQAIDSEEQSKKDKTFTRQQLIAQSLQKHRLHIEGEEGSVNQLRFKDLKLHIIQLKSGISKNQLDILKIQFENQVLQDKLIKIQKVNEQNDERDNQEISVQNLMAISPNQIVEVENKFNQINSKIMKVQREIINKETEISKYQFQLDKLANLNIKLQRELQTVEQQEKELIELDSVKKQEYSKLEIIYNQFTALNNERSLSIKQKPIIGTEQGDYTTSLIRSLVNKLRSLMSLHKNLINDPCLLLQEASSDEEEQSKNLELLIDEQLDYKLNELQQEYDQKKTLMKEDLKSQMRTLQILEEENQLLKSRASNISEKQTLISKADSVIKNLEFSFEIKREQIKELDERKKQNELKLQRLQDLFNDEKQKLP